MWGCRTYSVIHWEYYPSWTDFFTLLHSSLLLCVKRDCWITFLGAQQGTMTRVGIWVVCVFWAKAYFFFEELIVNETGFGVRKGPSWVRLQVERGKQLHKFIKLTRVQGKVLEQTWNKDGRKKKKHRTLHEHFHSKLQEEYNKTVIIYINLWIFLSCTGLKSSECLSNA